MTPEDDSEEEYLDDPIILIDFEQERRNRDSIEENGTASEKIVHIDLTDSDVEVSDKSSSATNTSTTLPVTFFNIPENVELLNECRPLCINVVDCEKHAWYYAKRIKSVEIDSDIIIVTDTDTQVCSIDRPNSKSIEPQDRTGAVTPTTEMNMLNTSPGNKPKIRPVDISLYMGHSKYDSNKSRMEPEKIIGNKNDNTKLDMHTVTTIIEKRDDTKEMHSGKQTKVFKNREVENQKAVEQKPRPIDFKKNKGLVGLKVTNMIQSSTKDNERKTEIKCLTILEKQVNVPYAAANEKQSNKEINRNLTKLEKRTPEKDQNNLPIDQISSAEKVLKRKQRKRRVRHADGNITIQEKDNIVELQSDPLRIKVVDMLTFENPIIATKHTESKPKQNYNKSDTRNGIQDQYRKENTSSAVDSVYVRKKKLQKNLTKHWKDTMRLFTKTKKALLNPKSAKTRMQNICTKAKELKIINIHEPEKNKECKERTLTVNLNMNKNTCIVNKKTDLAANTLKKNNDCITPVKVYYKNPKYKDMPSLDEDEVSNENDFLNNDSKFLNLSQNTINTKSFNDAKKLTMEVLPKDSSSNVKHLQIKNVDKNTMNSQNNTTKIDNNQLNPGGKYTSKPSFVELNNNLFGGSNQTNLGTSQTNKPARNNQPQQVHDNEYNSTKQNPVIQKHTVSNEKSIKKNTSNTMNVCNSLQRSLLKSSTTKSSVPQHSENKYCAFRLPDVTQTATDSNFSNSENRNVLLTKAKDDAATNLTVYVHAPRIPNTHSKGPYQEGLLSDILASNMSTASENKIDAGLRYDIEALNNPNNEVELINKADDVDFELNPNAYINNTLSNVSQTIPMDEYAVMVNTILPINMGNTQPNKQAMVLNTLVSHDNIGNTQSNVKSTDIHAMTLNHKSHDNIDNTQPNVSSLDKNAMVISNKNLGKTQSNVNPTDKNAMMTSTVPHTNMGHNQPNINLQSKVNPMDGYAMVLNNNSHDNMGNIHLNVSSLDKQNHTIMINNNMDVNLGNEQSHVNLTDKHAIMTNTGSHINMSNKPPDVSSVKKLEMTLNTNMHLNLGNDQPDISSLNKDAMMLNNNMQVNLGNKQSNVNSIDNNAMMTVIGSHNMSNNQPNVNSNDNKHTMMLNSNTYVNMGNVQSNVSQMDKHALMTNTGSNIYMNNAQSNVNSIDNHAMILNYGSHNITKPIVSPSDKLAMTLNTLNRPIQNQADNYYQSLGRSIETAASNMGKYYPRPPPPPPPYMNPPWRSGPMNKSHLRQKAVPKNIGCRPNYNRSVNVNIPANALPRVNMYNTYNAYQYTQFWNSAYPPPPPPPPPQNRPTQILQQQPLPKISEGSTVIGQNGNGFIRTINLKSMKSSLRNEGTYNSNYLNCPSDARTVNSKSEMLEELTKELNNVPNVVCSNTGVSHKADAHPNLTNSLSEKIGHSLPNIIMTRPKRAPLPRKAEFAPQFPSYQYSAFENTEYSPPILPIPTYQQTLEILTQMNMYGKASHPTELTNTARLNCLTTDKSLNKKAPVMKNAGNRKRKPPKSDDKQVKKKALKLQINKEQMSLDEYKKKISLEEYKNRESLNRNTVIQTVENFDGAKLEVAAKMTKDFDVKQNFDLDLGYDSDSTVKL